MTKTGNATRSVWPGSSLRRSSATQAFWAAKESVAAQDRLGQAGRAAGEGDQRGMIGLGGMDEIAARGAARRVEPDRNPPQLRQKAQRPHPAGAEKRLGPREPGRAAQPGEAERRLGKHHHGAEPPQRRDRGVERDSERHRDEHDIARRIPCPRHEAASRAERSASAPKPIAPAPGATIALRALQRAALSRKGARTFKAARPSAHSGGKRSRGARRCARARGCRHA